MTYPVIQLFQGATSVIEIDLTDFDLQGGEVVFTMRNKFGAKDIVKTCTFSTSELHNIVFTDEFTATLKTGSGYEYDIMHHLNEERFVQCEPTDIEVSRTVGGYQHESGD